MSEISPFERLRNALIERTGHSYYQDKHELLHERLRERMGAVKVGSIEEYLLLLQNDASGEAEWRALEDVTTVGETYFFRYTDHFDALRRKILPDLIARRLSERALRIWSIGCASGAEPYSVAIVLRELLGSAIQDWRISIVGGDISERALNTARAARYGQWALRTVTDEERARYFSRPDERTWLLKPEYRALVRFERQNILDLLSSAAPLQWTGYDLILCRNVLIYFSIERAMEIVAALRERLAPHGTLLLGHAEASLASEPSVAAPFVPEFTEALSLIPAPSPPPVLVMSRFVEPPRALVSATPVRGDDFEELRRLADSGAYEEAIERSKALLTREPMSARLHYYDAILHHVCDDTSGAETALRRALYLDRNFILAHHRLGLLLLGAGRVDEARRSLLTAVRLGATQPEEALLPEGQGADVGTFVANARAHLQTLGIAA